MRSSTILIFQGSQIRHVAQYPVHHLTALAAVPQRTAVQSVHPVRSPRFVVTIKDRIFKRRQKNKPVLVSKSFPTNTVLMVTPSLRSHMVTSQVLFPPFCTILCCHLLITPPSTGGPEAFTDAIAVDVEAVRPKTKNRHAVLWWHMTIVLAFMTMSQIICIL